MLLCSGTTCFFHISPTFSCNQKGRVACFAFKQYNLSCHCDSRYVGRRFQRLQGRIRQHVPKFIGTSQIPNSRNTFTRFCKSSISAMFSESVIGRHLLDNPMCAQYYSDKKLTNLSFGSSSFHLSSLEAIYIKVSKLNLCRQKEFVYNLKILRWLRFLTPFLNI